VSCSKDDDVQVDNTLSTYMVDNTLSTYILNKTIETEAVIACAGSDLDTNNVLVFYYPETGASNIRLYETVDAEVDNNKFSNYSRIEIEELPFFNGYLEKFIRNSEIEKWIVVTYELNGEIKISNPIRTKQFSRPSVWSDDVIINQETSAMPNFIWQHNAFGDNAIYFQVISDAQNNLLSGTYTFENEFQYYNTDNVVLNITIDAPPSLSIGTIYNFTLMDVSEDNWVNTIIQKAFEVQ